MRRKEGGEKADINAKAARDPAGDVPGVTGIDSGGANVSSPNQANRGGSTGAGSHATDSGNAAAVVAYQTGGASAILNEVSPSRSAFTSRTQSRRSSLRTMMHTGAKYFG